MASDGFFFQHFAHAWRSTAEAERKHKWWRERVSGAMTGKWGKCKNEEWEKCGRGINTVSAEDTGSLEGGGG